MPTSQETHIFSHSTIWYGYLQKIYPSILAVECANYTQNSVPRSGSRKIHRFIIPHGITQAYED